mgnify:FL=1|tara:strand:- start:1138 stop:1665 length:528 start_codon:yes stop_codon:yes gene_type:complete
MAFKHKGYNKHGWPFKTETDHENFHNTNENRDGNDAEGKPLKSGFKMKGGPMKRNFGIGADSPVKQTETPPPTYSGINFDGGNSYSTGDGTKIPGFRDFVSLEQQQAYADKVDARRAERKEEKAITKETERKKRQEEFVKTLPEVKTVEEPGLEDPLEKYVVNKPLTLPEQETDV